MSKIVAFRDRVIETLKEKVPDLRGEIDWYDGVFDEKDILDWSLTPPCAFVAVLSSPTQHHVTGEMLANLRCVCVIIDQDQSRPRDADQRVWTILEKVAEVANLSQFGDPNAGPACGIDFRRLVDPELRREGIATGLVEWNTNLTIGRNRTEEREYIYRDGIRVERTPWKLSADSEVFKGSEFAAHEIAVFTGEE